MQQLDFFDIPSPCVGVCQMNEKGLCRGCMRNREERFQWLEFNAEQKKNVIRLCKQRYYRQQLALRKAGIQIEDGQRNDQFDLFSE